MLADQVHLDHAFALSNSNHETMSPPIITRGCPKLHFDSKKNNCGYTKKRDLQNLDHEYLAKKTNTGQAIAVNRPVPETPRSTLVKTETKL